MKNKKIIPHTASVIALLAGQISQVMASNVVDLRDFEDQPRYSVDGKKYFASKTNPNVFYYYDETKKDYIAVGKIGYESVNPEEQARLKAEIDDLEKKHAIYLKRISDSEDLLARNKEKARVQLQAMSADEELLEIAQDKACLLNTFSAEDVTMYANLSAAVYSEHYDQSAIKAGKKDSRLDREISDLEQHRSLLLQAKESLRNFLKEGLRGKNPEKKEKELLRALNKLGIHLEKGIDLTKDGDISDAQAIISKIDGAIETTDKELRAKRQVQEGQNPEHLEQVKRALNLSAYGGRFNVEHILYRNNGEFSGVILYDRENQELTFVVAGSKSWRDWAWNFAGWNGKANPLHGNLHGLHIHTGFLSHFEAVQDSYIAFIRPWMEKWIEENKGKKLSIRGTGHSLGGALAELFTLSAVETAKRAGVELKSQGTITFGAPNVFHGNDLDGIIKAMGGKGNFLRIQDQYDPVPHAAFWRDSPGVVIRGNAGLFRDEAGVMQLPVRLNPHSSGDYAHFADIVFKAYQTKLTAVKKTVDNSSTLEKELEESQDGLASVMMSIHSKTAALANVEQRREYRQSKLIDLEKQKTQIEQEALTVAGQLRTAKISEIESLKRLLEILATRRETAKQQIEDLQKEEDTYQEELEKYRRNLEIERQKLLEGSLLKSIMSGSSLPGLQ